MPAQSLQALPEDGSRYLPWSNDRLTGYEHVHRYLFAAPLVEGKRVLDIACGEGYGAALLAHRARRVIGLDFDLAALRHARQRYTAQTPALHFIQADAQRFALAPRSLDAVVSFETLEHFEDHDAFLSAIRAALTDDGLLIISTPNKRTYSDTTGYRNPFHARELYRDEFLALLRRYFPHVALYGQSLAVGSAISAEPFLPPNKSLRAQFVHIDAEGIAAQPEVTYEPKYYVALCSASLLPQELPATLMLDEATTAYDLFADSDKRVAESLRALQEAAAYARVLETQNTDMIAELDRLRVYAEQQVIALRDAEPYARKLEAQIAEMQAAEADAAAYARKLEAQIAEMQAAEADAAAYARKLEAQIAEMQAAEADAAAYARKLEAQIAEKEQAEVDAAAYARKLEAYIAEKEAAEVEAATYARKLEGQINEMLAAQTEAANYARKLEAQIADMQRAEVDAATYARKLEGELVAVQAELDKAREYTAQQENALSDAATYAHKLEGELVAAQAELDKAREYITQQESALNDAATYAHKLEAEFAATQTELEKVREYTTQQEAATGEAVQYARKLEGELAAAQTELEKAREYTAQQDGALEAAAAYARTAEAYGADMKNALNDALEYVRKLETRINDLEDHLSQFRDA